MGPDFCVIIVLVLHTTAQGINQTLKTNPEAELTKRFLDEYAARGPFGRPLADVADLVNVTFGISLLQIMDLDEKNQVLTISVWDHYIWQDAFLTWEPGSYSGVTSIRLPYRRIWKPDITLYNYADERLEARRDSHVAVFYTGEVQWNPQAIYKSSCKIEIRRFPFDTQNCHLKFGSWTYSAQKLDLAFGDGLAAFDLSRYTVNNEWAMVGNVAVKREQNYTCCNETFQDLTFYLRLRRMSDLYSYILVIPCVLLSSLTLVLFWIPPQSPAKVQLGINIFVAFFVMMLILEESIPTAADSVPMIGRFYMTNMILITLSSFLAVLVANVALSADGKPVPRWANKIFVELLGKALCVNRSAESGHPETTDTPGTGNKTISSVCQKPGSPCQVTTSPGLDYDVHQISKDIKRAVAATTQTRMKVQREREWSTLARVIDRFLFAIYLVVILSSFVLLFPPETDDGSFQPEQSDS